MTEQPTSTTQAPDFNDPEVLAQLRARQRSRALFMAAILIALCVMFYVITIVKIGVWG
ncbi:MAG: hypothetical protein HEQ21_14995 [Blastomonas sp.]|jgi:hypothetical protein|uniref:hypothetical protein n=1 Tax=Blastomonas TaxID=150203 RepID=UPI000857130A|nr:MULTISPECIES: hypothetical protein [Blastomonas]AOF98895.1 hypothetical protein BSY18_525 [Blastomonas sp. RAC04]MCO5794125.1 hypothetical protein [Blastomonas sp.]MDK2757145.1 hypothetical protein [Blastomonas fulva]